MIECVSVEGKGSQAEPQGEVVWPEGRAPNGAMRPGYLMQKPTLWDCGGATRIL